MAATDIQQGSIALVWGAPSVNLAINGGSALVLGTGILIDNISHTRTADTVEVRNANGEVVNITTFNLGDEVTLAIKPAGSSRANAKAVNDAFPRQGGYAALIDSTDITHLDNAAITGLVGGVSAATTGVLYAIKGVSKASTSQGHVAWNVTLARHAGISSYAPLS